MTKTLIIILFPLIFLYLNSCTPASVVASSGVTTMVVAEGDRSLGSVVDDTTIKFNLSSKLLTEDANLFININSNVIGGRVLLTGIVDTQEIRIEAVRKTWEIEGVNEIINEIEIGNKTTLKEYASDLWINTQIKGVTAKTVGLRALSYNFETIRGKVYIAGITSKPEQLKNIIDNLKTIKGVKEIVNYVIIVD